MRPRSSGVSAGRRALFDHLLVPALHRALALEQMHDVSVMVGENLHLDVARPLDEPLDVERAVAERGHRLAPRALHRVRDVARVDDTPHALAAAAGRRLDQRGQADAIDRPAHAVIGLIVWRLAWHDRHAGRLHQAAAPRSSSPSAAMTSDGGPTKIRPARFARVGKRGVLREEAVARVHGVRAGRLGGAHELRNGQIAVARRRRAQCKRRDRRPPRAARARQPPSTPRRSRCQAPGTRE